MMKHYQLRIGDASTNGQVKIVDKDRLCYIVYSQSKGAKGLRTISQQLLDEYVEYFRQHPKASADDARNDLCGQTDIDKFEYGYTSTLTIMAKWCLIPTRSSMKATQIGISQIVTTAYSDATQLPSSPSHLYSWQAYQAQASRASYANWLMRQEENLLRRSKTIQL